MGIFLKKISEDIIQEFNIFREKLETTLLFPIELLVVTDGLSNLPV